MQMAKWFRYAWRLTHLNQLERAVENYMELIPSRRPRDSLNYSNSSYLVYNVTRALDGIKAVYLQAVCLLFLVNSVSVCMCVCVCVCVCVYNCVSIRQGLTLSSHIHFIQSAKQRGPLKMVISFTFIKTMPLSWLLLAFSSVCFEVSFYTGNRHNHQ